jgi:hypothetical protein
LPQFGQYHVRLLDHTAAKLIDLFPGDDFLSISWEHKRNQPGTYALELVGETTTKDAFEKHYQVLIERNWGTDPGDWYEEFVGFHLGYLEQWPTDEIDAHYWTSMGLSPEWLIDQALLQPLSTSNPDYYRYELWWEHGPTDDVIKKMVSESMVSAADTDRNFSHVIVEGDSGEANWGCYEGVWVRLSDAVIDSIGEDGTRGGCDYRVERVSGGYEFRTYAPYFGTDRRRGNADGNKPTIFSFQNGNMKNPERQVMWAQETTVAYGGWQGAGAEQVIIEETNDDALAETPYSRREQFYNVREDFASEDEVSGYLQQKLIDDGIDETITAQILQTDACLYGRDWWFGDLVTLDLPDGSTYDMRVVEARGRMSGDNEEEIEGVIEVWTREESV